MMTARFKDLTKKEMKHLREQGIRTLREFKVCAEKQAESRKVEPFEPCGHCYYIAKKLGLPV